MTWGIPTHLFLQIHVALSLVAMVVGLIALYGLLEGRTLSAWIALFLATAILTNVTGFPLPPFGFDPPRAVGVVRSSSSPLRFTQSTCSTSPDHGAGSLSPPR